MNRNFTYWLRWLILLPGALFVGALSSFPLHWILYATLRSEFIFMDPYPELPERILLPFVFSVVFIWFGSKIAPEHKLRTGIVLFSLWMLSVGVMVLLTISNESILGLELHFRGGGLGSIMGAVGALLGLYIVRKREIRGSQIPSIQETMQDFNK